MERAFWILSRRRNGVIRGSAALAAILFSWALRADAQAPAAAVAAKTKAGLWLAADGATPLPFQSDAEILEFLRKAKIKKVTSISVGVTGPQKVLLEMNGVLAHAHFNHVEEEKAVANFPGGKMERGFRDSHIFQRAAYELARILGLDNVPPAVERSVQGRTGTLTAWVENAFTEKDRLKQKIVPAKPQQWVRQMQNMHVWDNLVGNTDRNQGNILIDRDWKVWMIDHTRAFRRRDTLEDLPKFEMCGRRLLAALRALSESEVRQRLRPYLRGVEMDALLKRREQILARVEEMIREKGESAALFNDEPGTPR